MIVHSLHVLRDLNSLREDNGDLARGIYAGYPSCCIKSYIERRHEARSMNLTPLTIRQGAWVGTGFVPCAECSKQCVTPEGFAKFVEEKITPNRVPGIKLTAHTDFMYEAAEFVEFQRDFRMLMAGVRVCYMVDRTRFKVYKQSNRVLVDIKRCKSRIPVALNQGTS